MDRAELDALLPEVKRLCCRAAEAILDVYGRADHGVEAKDDRSPLTDADMAAHHLLVEGLSALLPGIPVMSEESAGVPWDQRRHWRRHWLVDPLDGTREFIKRNGEFTVNVALIEQHEPVLGVIQQPVSGYLAWARRGAGAFAQHAAQAPRRLRVRIPAPARPVVAASRSHSDRRMAVYLAQLGEHELIRLGSSLKFCWLAEGRLDLYLRLGPTSEWDTAAAQCILEEAGGQVTDLRGVRLRYNCRESVLNPEFMAFADPARDWRGPLAGWEDAHGEHH